MDYWGSYFLGDFCSGWIRSLKPGAGTVADFATGISGLVDLSTSADGSLYYLARGTGSNTGTVHRISYVFDSPRIDLTANGGHGPVVFTASGPLELQASFDAGPSGFINGDVYIGAFTPLGVFWVSPEGNFVASLARVYAGPIGSFRVVDVPQPGQFRRPALWTVLVVHDRRARGSPSTTYSDMVLTIVP